MSIAFKKIASAKPVSRYLADILQRELVSGSKVLWLVPGGSAIKVAVETSRELKDSKNLTIGLSDERYGAPAHPDSNWQQLVEAGFKFGDARQLAVLTGDSLEQSAKKYGAALERSLKEADFSVALLGVGADAHIAGIKPDSPALAQDKAVVGYAWNDFARISITPGFMKRLDLAVVYAVGQEKWPVLDGLSQRRPIKEQPVQVLKTIRRAIIF